MYATKERDEQNKRVVRCLYMIIVFIEGPISTKSKDWAGKVLLNFKHTINLNIFYCTYKHTIGLGRKLIRAYRVPVVT